MLGRVEAGERVEGEGGRETQYDPNAQNILPFVSRETVETYGEGKKTIDRKSVV